MRYVYMLSLLILSTLLSACGASNAQEPKKTGGMGGFAVKVMVATVTPQMLEEKVSMVGSLAANEAVDIQSEIDGIMKEIKFDEGQKVTKGQILIVLDRQKLEASLEQSKASLSIAQATFDRMKTLVESGAVSRQEFDQAQATFNEQQAQVNLLQAQLDDTEIIASFDGTVGERKVSPGQVITKGSVLTVLIDDNPMKIEFHVPERYLGRLSVGQTVNLKVAASLNLEFQGQVYFIDPQVNDLTRTALVKAKIDNPQGLLRRGMFAKLDVVIDEKANALVVPETALINNGDQGIVFTVDKEHKAQMNMVKTGLRSNGVIEITEGLSAGDVVITEGFQKIGPGSLVDPVTADAVVETQAKAGP